MESDAEGEKGAEAADVTALVEFHCKAVNVEQAVTIMEAIHVLGVLHTITSRITRIVSVGKRRKDRRVLPKARPNKTGPSSGEGSWRRFLPYDLKRPYGRGPQCSSPPAQGAEMEDADSQGAGAPGRPVRQDVYVAIGHDSAGALLAKDSLERMVMKRIKRNQGDETPGQQQGRCPGGDPENMAKRQKQLKICPWPRLSRVGLSKYQLTISTIIPFSRTTRRNECETAAIRNEQKIGTEDIVCSLLLTNY